MKKYDAIGFNYVPYSLYTQARRYNSDIINTDNLGFRITESKDGKCLVENIDSYEGCSIITGGSTVFGVGASTDNETISSRLAFMQDDKWSNFGIRSANLMQEFINFSTYALHNIKKVNNEDSKSSYCGRRRLHRHTLLH